MNQFYINIALINYTEVTNYIIPRHYCLYLCAIRIIEDSCCFLLFILRVIYCFCRKPNVTLVAAAVTDNTNIDGDMKVVFLSALRR